MALLLALLFSCKSEFIELTPKGKLDASVLATKDGVDAILIGAYGLIDGVSSTGFGWEAASSNWLYGSIRGLEANRGSDSGDNSDMLPIQTYSELPTNSF